MDTKAIAPPPRAARITLRLTMAGLACALSAVTACHDAPTAPVSPATPTLAVSTDGAWLVNSLADPGDGICTNSECTLREAIIAAQEGDRITFKSNLSGTIMLVLGVLRIDKNLTIEGPGADVLTVDGNNTTNIFQIGLFEPAVVTISGLTIAHGKAFGNGGGIYVGFDSRVAVIRSAVIGGSSTTLGGGIYSHGHLTVLLSTVSGNLAGVAGGGIASHGILTVSRSTVSENATFGQGGGIWADCGVPVCQPSLTLRSSTITANNAVDAGGGVYFNFDGVMSNTILAGNRLNGDLTASQANCSEFGTAFSQGYNLLAPLSTCSVTTMPTDVILASAPLVFTSVLETVLADNGGSVPTHALFERGFAVDAGYCPAETTDQRLVPRPYDDLRMPNALDGCDIGAFEWHPADTKGKGPKP